MRGGARVAFSALVVLAVATSTLQVRTAQAARRMSHPSHGHHSPIGAARTTTTVSSSSPSGSAAQSLEKKKERAFFHVRARDTAVQLVAGSSLPDCSHACGSCSPCRLVMVSFVCSALEEAETCPMAYKCMCNSKSYPVP